MGKSAVVDLEAQKLAFETFLEAALDQSEQVTALGAALFAFGSVFILGAFGLRQSETNHAIKAPALLYTCILSGALAVLIGFVSRMAVSGYFYELGVKQKPLDTDAIDNLGGTLTYLSAVEQLVAVIGVICLVVWVFLNKRNDQGGANE